MKQKKTGPEPPEPTKDTTSDLPTGGSYGTSEAHGLTGHTPPADVRTRTPINGTGKRRTPLELFRDQKKEHEDAVEETRLAIKSAELAHADAIEKRDAFLKDAREALGL